MTREKIIFLNAIFQVYKQQNLKVKGELLYRGSEHGWMAKDFHDKCDEVLNTISLFQIKDGDLIGGFTTTKWFTPQGGDVFGYDKDSMLFNLNEFRHYPCKIYECAIWNYPNCGPYFGLNGELQTLEPFNEPDHCSASMHENWCYKVPQDDNKKSMLTNTKVGANLTQTKFTISELEVWQLTFSKH